MRAMSPRSVRKLTFPMYSQGQTSPVGSLQVCLDKQGLPILPILPNQLHDQAVE